MGTTANTAGLSDPPRRYETSEKVVEVAAEAAWVWEPLLGAAQLTQSNVVNRRGVPDADRHTKLLIHLTLVGSHFGAYSHIMSQTAARLTCGLHYEVFGTGVCRGVSVKPRGV
jgi:hypothetical protein